MTRDLDEQLIPINTSRETLAVSSTVEFGYRDGCPTLALSQIYQSRANSLGQSQNTIGSSTYDPRRSTSSIAQSIGVHLEEAIPPHTLEISSRDRLLLGWLCIGQLAAGGILIILNFIGILMNTTHLFGDAGVQIVAFNVAPGIWIPLIFFSTSAAMTICTLHKQTACRFIANMVLSIASTIFAVLLLGFAVWATYASSHIKADLALSVTFLLASLVAVGVGVWASAINNRLICGKDAEQSNSAYVHVQHRQQSSTVAVSPLDLSCRQWPLGAAHVTHDHDRRAPVLASPDPRDSILTLPVE